MFVNHGRLCSELERLCQTFKVKISVRNCKVTSDGGKFSVEIPKRIERGPTDILKALSSTVERDPTAFHFKYPDDPFFVPYSQISKRALALSLESGKRSAKYIFENHPDFFKGISGQPFIKFQDLESDGEKNELSEITEEKLKESIKKRNVSSAIEFFETLEKKNIEISKDTRQELLELVCFYNCENKENEEDLELKWFESSKVRFDTKTWKDNGFAEKLFESLGPECPLSSSAIILGRLKFKQIDKAVELFDSVREKKVKLPVSVYNEVIKNVTNIKEKNEKRWIYIKDLLEEMEEIKVQPNLFTLNAVLFALHEMRNWIEAKKYAVKVVAEFKRLEIEPSLGSYSYLLNILSHKNPDKNMVKAFSEELLLNLLHMELEVVHPSDLYFFNNAMALFALELKNSHLGTLLNQLLETKNNIKFITKGLNLNLYYRNYLNLIFGTQPLETAMEVYRNLVPTAYTPEFQVHVQIVSAIQREDSYEILPEFWKNIKQENSDRIFILLEKLLGLTSQYKGKEGDEVWEVFQEAATNVLNLMKDKTKSVAVVRSDALFSSMFLAFTKNGRHEKAFEVIKAAFEELDQLTGATLKLFSNFCLDKKEFPLVLACLKYGEQRKFSEVFEMAETALPLLKGLDERDLIWVEKLAKKPRDSDSS